MKTKALVLFSGGLDSRLVIKLLQEQSIDVEAVYIKLPFGSGCCNDFQCVFNYSQIQGVKLHVIDCTKPPLFNEYMEIIKNPKYGRGVSLNPCKDCKLFLLKKAKELGENIKADFLATGEVLGQRPNSQYKSHMILIEKQAGLDGKVLRPLSAKLLPETEAEKKGLVDRNKLLAIEGRQRKKQIELAKKYNIKYPAPAGGCLLCEKDYCKKLKEFLNFKEKLNIKNEEIQLLSLGKHFRSPLTKNKIILGRNEEQNQQLEQINQTLKYNIIIPKTIPGPTAIFENIQDKELAEQLIKIHSSKNNSKDKSKKQFEKLRI
jgi:tRNA U34 2-thiouridine synthase MnmA/TrmU